MIYWFPFSCICKIWLCISCMNLLFHPWQWEVKCNMGTFQQRGPGSSPSWAGILKNKLFVLPTQQIRLCLFLQWQLVLFHWVFTWMNCFHAGFIVALRAKADSSNLLQWVWIPLCLCFCKFFLFVTGSKGFCNRRAQSSAPAFPAQTPQFRLLPDSSSRHVCSLLEFQIAAFNGWVQVKLCLIWNGPQLCFWIPPARL